MNKNCLLRVQLSRLERNAALRHNANPLKCLSKENAAKAGAVLEQTSWHCTTRIVIEVGGNSFLELWAPGREVHAWLPAADLRVVDNLADDLGIAGGMVIQHLLGEAVKSEAALKRCRFAFAPKPSLRAKGSTSKGTK